MKYIARQCLFCNEDQQLETLYPENFNDQDINPALFSARRVTEHFHYEIVRCIKCGLVFSRKILSEEDLLKLYSKSRVTFDEYTNIIRKDYWRHLKPYINENNKGSALEIGCSSGYFLEELLEQGFHEVFGCEPSLEAREKGSPLVKNQITSGFFKKGVYKKNSFDLICSFHALDHLSDPIAALDICRDILKPRGRIYFIVHNIDSFLSRLLGEGSPIIDIEHIYLFNKNTLRRLFEMSSFRVLEVSDIENSYPIKYWIKMLSLKWPVGFLGSISMPIKAGNIFIVGECNVPRK